METLPLPVDKIESRGGVAVARHAARAVGVFFGLFGLLKIAAPSEIQTAFGAISIAMARAIGAFEIALGALLLVRPNYRHLCAASVVLLVFCLNALAQSSLKTDCGCTGTALSLRREIVAAVSGIAMIAASLSLRSLRRAAGVKSP